MTRVYSIRRCCRGCCARAARRLSAVRRHCFLWLRVFCGGRSREKLRAVCVSGECMDARTGLRLAEAFPAADIYHVYGLTEAGPRVSYLPPALFRDHPDSVGIPLRTAAVQIRRRDGRPAAPGEIGSLYVRGRSIMLGYYGAPEATDAVLQNGWLYTGDAALLDENGLLYIKGREDDMINKAGMNVYSPGTGQRAAGRARRARGDGLRLPLAVGVQIGLKLAGDFGRCARFARSAVTCCRRMQCRRKSNVCWSLTKTARAS